MDTKEKIKDRVLRRAAQAWGYTDEEMETSFDPVVSLMLNAISSELEKLSAEMFNSRSRIVERLLEIMSPEDKTGVLPARSIMHCSPLRNNVQISLNQVFTCRKSIQNIYDPLVPIIKEIKFGAILPCILTQLSLDYLAFGNVIYSLKRLIHKDKIAESKNYLKQGTVWLGLCVPKNEETKEIIHEIEKLMIYVSVKKSSQQDIFYNYFRRAKFFIGGKEIAVEEGYNVKNSIIDVDAAVNKNYNKINQIYDEVNDYFSEKYFHFAENFEISDEILKTPEELQIFDSEQFKLEERKEDIVWVKIELSEVVSADILENVMFYVNAVPVINKEMLFQSHLADPFINYIPMASEDIFLDLENIVDTDGNRYDLKEFSEGNLQIGESTIRNTGIVRFDERNAAELLQYLIELVKDEIAAFTAIGGDFINDTLINIRQKIAEMEQVIKEKEFTKVNIPYAIVRPRNRKKEIANDSNRLLVIVNYWVTAGEDGNGIKAGTRLEIGQNNISIDKDSVMLLENSAGGKTRLGTQEKITSYREILLTRGRVVTFADIKVFTQNHFKGTIKKIEIKKGTQIDTSLDSGFVRTIDILIRKNPDFQIPETEWQYLCESFPVKLKKVSLNIHPYRLIVEE